MLHRYVRLTIPVAFILGFIITFLPVIASKTNQFTYHVALQQAESCTQYGWSILLYLNNFFVGGNDCIGVTWYLCDDMIFFWISPVVIYPMWNNKRGQAVFYWFVWLAASTFPSVYQTWRFKFGVDGNYVEGADLQFLEVYAKTTTFYFAPWNRFQPYLIGILFGYILHTTRGKQVKISPKLNIICWQAAFLSAFSVVYGLYSEHERGKLTNLEYTLYNGFHRIVWSMSLGWVIFSCSKGNIFSRVSIIAMFAFYLYQNIRFISFSIILKIFRIDLK